MKKRNLHRLPANIFLAILFIVFPFLSILSTTYYSQGSLAPNSLSSWNTVRTGGGATPGAFNASNDVFIIQNGHTMTTDAAWIFGATDSKLEIEDGGKLVAKHDITINNSTTTIFQIDNGGTYVQDVAMAMGSNIFRGKEVFASNSNIEIKQTPAGVTAPSLPGWGNVVIDIASGGILTWGDNLAHIQGDLVINSTGGSRHTLSASTNTTSAIGGNLTLNGGDFRLTDGSGSSDLTVNGTVTINGGTLNLAGSSGVGTLIVLGSVTLSGGTITETGSSTSSKIVFNKAGEQTFTSGSTISNTVNFEVGSSSTLNMGTSVISGGGSFTLSAGATLKTSNTSGLNGAITVSGTKTLDASANYIFNGSSAQTESLLSAANNITISNNVGTTLAHHLTASTLTIDAGATLNVNPDIQLTVTTLTNNGTVSLKSSSMGTATLIPETIAGTGTYNVEQYLPTGNKNWYISSPVTSGKLPFVGYEFNESNGTWSSQYAANTSMIVGEGYITVPSIASTMTFTGTINNADYDVSNKLWIQRTETSSKKGYNLVGNPYTAYLNWDAVAALTANENLEKTIWYRTRKSDGSYCFATYNSMGSMAVSNGANTTITGKIPPMQAFWTLLKANGTNTDYLSYLTILKTMRVHRTDVGNSFKAPAAVQKQLLRLQLSNGTVTDETLLYTNPNAVSGKDNYDSYKMMDSPGSPGLYTLIDGEKFVINGMSTFPVDTEIPLGFVPGSAGSFTISASEISNLPDHLSVLIKDKNTAAIVNLTKGENLHFIAENIATENRFSVIFKSDLNTSIPTDNSPKIAVFVQKGGKIAVFGVKNEAIKSLKLFTLTGDEVPLTYNLNSGYSVNSTLNTGIYVISITTETSILNCKLSVNL